LGFSGLAAELLIGVVLGPTIHGRASPELEIWLFPQTGLQATVLHTVSQISLWLFLSDG